MLARVPGAAETKAEQTTGLPMLRVRVETGRPSLVMESTPKTSSMWFKQSEGRRPASFSKAKGGLRSRFASPTACETTSMRSESSESPLPRRQGPRGYCRCPSSAASQWRMDRLRSAGTGSAGASTSRQTSEGRDLASFVGEAQAAVDREVELPPGVDRRVGRTVSKTSRPPRDAPLDPRTPGPPTHLRDAVLNVQLGSARGADLLQRPAGRHRLASWPSR